MWHRRGTSVEVPQILDYLDIVRKRLQDLEKEDGPHGLNQQAVYETLRAAMGDLRAGREVLEALTWWLQLQSAHAGLDQAAEALHVAMGDAAAGEFEWLAPGWGAAVCFLLTDAEELTEEGEALNYVHPADVLALDEGAEEAPTTAVGNMQQCIQQLLRDVRAMLLMLGGHKERDLLRDLEEDLTRPVTVDSQTTDDGEPRPQSLFEPAPQDGGQWRPQLGMDQWPGSIPSSATDRGTHRALTVGTD